jgi:L,D-transpeptidase YbiS
MEHQLKMVNKKPQNLSPKRLYFSALLTGLALAYFIFSHAASIGAYVVKLSAPYLSDSPSNFSEEPKSNNTFIKEIKNLKKRHKKFAPKIPYLIISTSDNRISLMKRDRLIHGGPCSSGSYVILKASGNRKWVFSTPRGAFKIQMKLKEPVWYMPDWAFIEEGRKVPPPNSDIRYNSKALGKYALSIGGGYLIHGTLYTRLIGQPVTHGCIRLADEELNLVYKHLRYGAKVYIY